MAYCVGCGERIGDGVGFCAACGQANRPPGPDVQSVPKLHYTIEGQNLQMARVHLKNGQEIYAEAGKMVYKTPNVTWQTRMSGNTIGQKILGAIKRKLMGESLFLTYFRANGDGEVGFAGTYPGRIQVFPLVAGQTVLVQRDAFLFAQTDVTLDIALVKKLGAGFFGGEGFVLEKLTGPGHVFIHGGGDFVEFQLRPAESLQIEPGNIVAFDDGMNYDIQYVGGVKTAIFGGEGMFLATLTGPGKCIIQSLTLHRLRRELAPSASRHGGDDKNPLSAITNMLSSDD